MKVQRDPKKIDLDILDQIIGKCEDGMVSPFKKKPAVAVEIEPKEDESQESSDDEAGEKPDLSDMDLEDLLKMYQERGGK